MSPLEGLAQQPEFVATTTTPETAGGPESAGLAKVNTRDNFFNTWSKIVNNHQRHFAEHKLQEGDGGKR